MNNDAVRSQLRAGVCRQCGSQIERQISAYKKLVKAANDEASGGNKRLASAIGAFEPLFSNHMDPEKSISGRQAGDRIELTEADFQRLSKAFLAEIQKKYP